MAKKLTKIDQPQTIPNKLTSNIHSPFVLGFKHKLYSGFTFKELTKENLGEFQRFLNKIADQTVTDVDRLYARTPDSNDVAYGKNVRHYLVTDVFRIHVILEDGVYNVLRLDPKHKVH